MDYLDIEYMALKLESETEKAKAQIIETSLRELYTRLSEIENIDLKQALEHIFDIKKSIDNILTFITVQS